MSTTISTEEEIYFVAERGYPHEGGLHWVGEWSGKLEECRAFLSNFHTRPDEETRIVKVVKTETRTIELSANNAVSQPGQPQSNT